MEDERRYTQALDQAARLWGIEPQFWDIWGKLHVTSAETKRAILQAMGAPVATAESLEEAIAERRRKERERLVPPCLVISENARPREAPVSAEGPIEIEIVDEEGSVDAYRIHAVGMRFLLPERLPLGYYDVTVTAGARPAEKMRLIITPDRAWEPEKLHAAGVAISLYGVRSRRNWGCGDFRDLCDLADWAAAETG